MMTRKNQRRQLKRQAILEAASAVFGEVGVHSATLEQIGDKVGLSKTSLYYYVDSKEELVAEVLRSVLAEIDTRAESLIGDNASIPDELTARAKAHVHTAVYSPAGRLIVSSLDFLGEQKVTAAMLRKHEKAVRQLLIRAQAEGALRKVDVTVLVKLFYGALNNIPRWQEGDAESLDDAIESTIDILLHGVLAPGPSAGKR